MTFRTGALALLAVFAVLVLFFPAGGSWFEIRAIIIYVAIIVGVVWLSWWIDRLGNTVDAIRRALEKRAAMHDQDRTEEAPRMLDDSEYTAGELASLNEWFQLHDELLPEDGRFFGSAATGFRGCCRSCPGREGHLRKGIPKYAARDCCP